jgi:hypothetical protein
MPFLLFFLGVLLIVVGVRGTQGPFIALVGGDFSGQGNFFYWVVALVLIGSIGYIPKAKPVSDGLLIVIILALFLNRGKNGIFTQITAALSSTKTPSAAAIPNTGNTISNLAAGSITPGAGTGTFGGT